MASVQAKIGWKRPRNGKNKNYRSVCSYSTRNRKFQKYSKKIQNLKKNRYEFISSQSRLEKYEKVRKEKLWFHSVPTLRVIENSKKIAKKFKKLENTVIASFQSKIGWRGPKKRENKNYRSVSFLFDA